MLNRQKASAGFTLDKKLIEKLDKKKNKSKFVNDLLSSYFGKKKEKDEKNLQIISDFAQQVKDLNLKFDNLNSKLDKLNELLNINVNCSIIAMQTIKAIKPEFVIKEMAAGLKEGAEVQISKFFKDNIKKNNVKIV